MLKIENPVARLTGGGSQQLERVGMAIEEIGMLAQIGFDLARADFGRPHGRGKAAADRLWLVLRTIGHVYFRGAAPERGPEENEAAKFAIMRNPSET
jgi:hypothetical protein